MKKLINIQEASNTAGPSYAGYEFGFLIDSNKFE